MITFIGLDLGLYGKTTGLASIQFLGSELRLHSIERLETVDEILGWIQSESDGRSALAAVDAPLIIRNQTWHSTRRT